MAHLANDLRRAIRNSGLTVNGLAVKAGISQPTLFRFMNGKDMGIGRAAKVARFLGLELTSTKTK